MGAMMPALMVTPSVMVVAPRAMNAKLLRTIFGLDDAAAGGCGIGRIFLVIRVIVIVRVIVPNTSDEDAPEVTPVGEVTAAVTGTAADDRRTGAGRAALIRRAALEAAAVSGMSTVSAMATRPAVATPNFDRYSVGRDSACSRGTRIDGRQSFSAFAREGRQREERCRREAKQSRRSSG